MSSKIKLLIVDDDPIIRAVYKKVFKKDFEFKMVECGEDVFDALNDFWPDVILLDIMMPGMNGYEVCEKLRSDERFSFLKIILVSAKSLLEERIKGYEAGADDYITKPFDDQELIAKVKVHSRLKTKEEVDNLKRHFMMLLSHETRTPLNGILGFADLLKMSENLSEEEKEYVEQILESGKDLLNLSDKTLFLSDLKNEKISMTKVPHVFMELLNQCLALIKEKAEKKKISCQVDIQGEGAISVDEKYFKQALSHLLDNAVKFAEEGTTVQIKLEKNDEGTNISIINKGPRIPEKQVRHLFDGFVVADTEHHQRGSGLSLAIVERIIALHDGSVSVHNLEDGPQFQIFLSKE